jgi:hypothetical protein
LESRAGGLSSRSGRSVGAPCSDQERGVDPIQVLFDAIEHFMERAKETTGDEQDGHVLSAVSIAKEAAPYCHPKLRAVELTGRSGSPLVPITHPSPPQGMYQPPLTWITWPVT